MRVALHLHSSRRPGATPLDPIKGQPLKNSRSGATRPCGSRAKPWPSFDNPLIRQLFLLLTLLIPTPLAAANLADLAFTQHPGAILPYDAPLTDESGQPTSLRALAGGKPMILAPGYFRCPNLCGTVRDDLFSTLAQSKLRPGQDYAVAVITIDPNETPADATDAKRDDLARYPLPGAPGALHFLTGTAPALQAIAAAEGFHAQWDPQLHQFMHPAGLVLATPDGRVSSYLLGVGYTPAALDAALTGARAGISSLADPILLLCFHFDANTGRYTLAIMKVVRLGGILTVLGILGLIWTLRRRRA